MVQGSRIRLVLGCEYSANLCEKGNRDGKVAAKKWPSLLHCTIHNGQWVLLQKPPPTQMDELSASELYACPTA